MTKFDNDIMILLRRDLGLNDTDCSCDEKINDYSVNEAYTHLLKFGSYSDFDVKITPEWIDYWNSHPLSGDK